jgi:D-alanyl-D-alanine carboxypeptidase
VNIRSTASKSGDVVGALPGGETADVLGYEDGWAHISYNGLSGYVSRDYTIPRHQPDIDVPSGDWASILVNQRNLLPDGFSVEVADFSGGQVDQRILDISKAMFADAKADGVTLKLVDAYRSYDLQKKLFEDKVNSYLAKGYNQEDAEAQASTITAHPNTSEHQTGLALDIVTPSYTKRDKGFVNTAAFKWLNANAQDYGFTLRYKKGKQDLTGVIYEPWHWRFVGVKAARAMKKSGEVLEEYFS